MAVLPKAQMNQFYINQKNVGAPYCFIPYTEEVYVFHVQLLGTAKWQA
jgi:hypothetical protein